MNSEQVLDFQHIRQKLADVCSSAIAKEYALNLQPMHNRQKIEDALDETVEAMRSLEQEVEQPISGTKDIRTTCTKSRKEIILTREELWDLHTTILAYNRMHRFFKEKYLLYPLLSLWVQDLPSHDKLTKRFERTFDAYGILLDSATPKLQQLRMTMSRTKNAIKNDLQRILQDKDNQKYFQEAIVTMRNNRYVIPVKQEYRGAFPGLIHDRSATGATLYIEPMRLVDLNNELQEATLAEEQEVLRIYKELTELVRGHADTLLDACKRVSHVEFVYGKAELAIRMKAVRATISQGREVNLLQARHPMLAPNVVVPTTITLGTKYRILLITGSNTGGKTVSLKTLGLLALMNQSGLCIPADSGSTLPIFHHIYADIGDEQSIEASLSTFSAHMTQVIGILKRVGPNDLVLLDELGSGTDPEEGSALGIAIIEYFRKKGALMMVSTHYNELKTYAYQTEGVENGHVEFDERTLRPTYRLHIGVAGSSHALSIAARLGLPQEVVDLARKQWELNGRSAMEDMLRELNQELRKTQERERALKKEQEEVRRMRTQVMRDKKALQDKKKVILEKAREEAQNMKRSVRIESEQIIKELKGSFNETDKQKRQDAISKARKGVSNVAVPTGVIEKREHLDVSKVKVGDVVFLDNLQSLGTILVIQGKRIQVDMNGLTVTVKEKDLLATTREEASALLRKENSVPMSNRQRKRSGMAVIRQQQASTELNIIGKTVDEAIVEVGRFIDQAILAGLNSVRIVHGKGTGALRAGVHDYLRTLPGIKSYDLASLDEGGAGATTVILW